MNWIYNLMENFLNDVNIEKNVLALIDNEANKLNSQFPNALANQIRDNDYIYKILCEKYNLNSKNVKAIEETLVKKGYKFGRISKNALKLYLDYRKETDLDGFINTLKLENGMDIEKEYIQNILLFCEPIEKKTIQEKFLELWLEAKEKDDTIKLKDYLLGIYSKLFSDALANIKLMDILNYNYDLIKKELQEESLNELKDFCMSKVELMPIKLATKVYSEKYMEILKKEFQQASINRMLDDYLNQYYVDKDLDNHSLIFDRGNDIKLLPTEEYELVYFQIDQDMYNRFDNEDDFLDHVLTTIKEIYRVLANEKVLSIKVENIYTENGKNLKWDLYSKITIYAEHFIRYKEKSSFYKPHEIALDFLQKHDFKLIIEDSKENRKKVLKDYYKNKISKDDLFSMIQVNMEREDFFELIDRFYFVHYGFDFNDCIILDRGSKTFDNGELNNIIENTTEILLIFYKYRADQRKIPCPSCGGIKISGNSYPHLNHRSWECKSPICPDRSKSNRGKRFQKKSNYMQWAAIHPQSNDIIPRQLITKWRRDIVSIKEDEEIIEMLVKYFSFTEEKILFINTNLKPKTICESENRKAVILSNKINENVYISEITIKENLKGELKFFENIDYLRNFTELKIKENENDISLIISDFLNNNSKLKLIHGDSYNVLKNIEDNKFTAAVTSPPYYNAREYSQWPNLYLYFYDMYNIIKETFRTMVPGGVFLYNIADIVDNENTVVKSKMGEKRIPLGAYTIYFFKLAGFELLDNIIWDKGEPQSNRQKNDGKFTPHYQKPLNAYEHMFIFKKPGENLILSDNWREKRGKWTKNIVEINPVIKINPNGENTFGHTAPFPVDIPEYVTNIFTQHSNDIVLDPFSGSLTSAIVAAKCNRIGLGIELSEEYVELSKKRSSLEELNVDVLYYT